MDVEVSLTALLIEVLAPGFIFVGKRLTDATFGALLQPAQDRMKQVVTRGYISIQRDLHLQHAIEKGIAQTTLAGDDTPWVQALQNSLMDKRRREARVLVAQTVLEMSSSKDVPYELASQLEIPVDFHSRFGELLWEIRRQLTTLEPYGAFIEFADHEHGRRFLQQVRNELAVVREHIEKGHLDQAQLLEKAQQSLIRHQKRFAVKSGDKIVRDVQSKVMALLEQSSLPLIAIRGVSGTGKSTLVRQIGENINTRGGVALWLRAETIEPGTSLDAALLRTLQGVDSTLGSQAGHEAIQLASQVPFGLVLLVDDVNRVGLYRPDSLLRTIQEWAHEYTLVRFIVPIWPEQAVEPGPSHISSQQEIKWVNVELQAYNSRERVDVARLISQSRFQIAHEVIEALDGDPFLCSLLRPDDVFSPGIRRLELIKQTFDSWLDHAVKDVVSVRKGVGATQGEFLEVLDRLVELLLNLQIPEPDWKVIRSNFSLREVDLLHAWAASNQLGWLEHTDVNERWVWKHERLRDILIGRWLAHYFVNSEYPENEQLIERISDPVS